MTDRPPGTLFARSNSNEEREIPARFFWRLFFLAARKTELDAFDWLPSAGVTGLEIQILRANHAEW